MHWYKTNFIRLYYKTDTCQETFFNLCNTNEVFLFKKTTLRQFTNRRHIWAWFLVIIWTLVHNHNWLRRFCQSYQLLSISDHWSTEVLRWEIRLIFDYCWYRHICGMLRLVLNGLWIEPTCLYSNLFAGYYSIGPDSLSWYRYGCLHCMEFQFKLRCRLLSLLCKWWP